MIDITKLKYAVFDWDNTLADTRSHLVETVNKVLAEYNLPGWDIVKRRRNPELSFRDNFINIFGAELAEEAYEKYVEHYQSGSANSLKTFPGVLSVLDYLDDNGVELFVMTNKDRRLFDIELPVLFNPQLFAGTLAGHEAPRDKPHPEQVRFLLKDRVDPAMITPENVWVVGDSAQDSSCALAANARAIRIGQPIWGDDAGLDDRINWFKDFKAFAAAIGA